MAIRYTGARSSYARLEGNVIRRNSGPFRDCFGASPPAPWIYGQSVCGGVYVTGPAGIDLGVVLSGNLIEDNVSIPRIGGACVWAQAAIEHDVIRANEGYGLDLGRGPVSVLNVAVAGNGAGVHLRCGGSYALDDVTIAGGTSRGILASGSEDASIRVENAIVWGDPGAISLDLRCTGTAPSIASSLIRGGYASGTDIIDADPRFVLGPLGNYYLSQTSAGQPLTSPAVDTGSVPSSDLGLDKRTTATTSAPDDGTVDMGYHYPPVAAIVIERGTVASLLSAYRTVVDLPWDDDPGTLSDPALPLLFYRIPAASQDIGIDKSVALDTVRLSWR